MLSKENYLKITFSTDNITIFVIQLVLAWENLDTRDILLFLRTIVRGLFIWVVSDNLYKQPILSFKLEITLKLLCSYKTLEGANLSKSKTPIWVWMVKVRNDDTFIVLWYVWPWRVKGLKSVFSFFSCLFWLHQKWLMMPQKQAS